MSSPPNKNEEEKREIETEQIGDEFDVEQSVPTRRRMIEAFICSPIEETRIKIEKQKAFDLEQLSHPTRRGECSEIKRKADMLVKKNKIPGTIVSPIELERGRQQHQQNRSSSARTVVTNAAAALQAPNFIRRLQTHLSLPGAVAVPGIEARQSGATEPTLPTRTSTSTATDESNNDDEQILVSATIVNDDPTTAWWVAEARPAGKHRWKWLILVSILLISLAFCVTIIYMQGQSVRSRIVTPPFPSNDGGGTGNGAPLPEVVSQSFAPLSEEPTMAAVAEPSMLASSLPSLMPTETNSEPPTMIPSPNPSTVPSTQPPTAMPSFLPSLSPSVSPSVSPTVVPTFSPTLSREWTQVGQDMYGFSSGDFFGQSVAIAKTHGDVVAVGAHLSDSNGIDSGLVKVMALVEDQWRQIGQDLVGNTLGNQAGWAIDLSADGLILAVAGWTGGFLLEGTVRMYVYSTDDNRWYKLGQDLYGGTPAVFFGASVSLSDDGLTVAVGADYGSDGASYTGTTNVYRYSRFTAQWEPIGEPVSGLAENDRFGWDVSLSGDGLVLAVGAIAYDCSNGENCGRVRMYYYESFDWHPFGQALDGDGTGDNFGYAVSTSHDGHVVAASSFNVDANATEVGGYVHVHRLDEETSLWTQLGQTIVGESADVQVGRSLSLSPDGKTLSVGTAMKESSGAVRVYRFNEEQQLWTLIRDPISGGTEDSGASVALAENDRVIFGAPDFGGFPFTNSGRVQVYDLV